MSLHRWAKRRDKSEPAIIATLEAHGFEVWPVDKPCDLIVRKQDWAPGLVQLLECKTIREDRKKILVDKRQSAQRNFLAGTGTPVVTNPVEALKAVGVMS